MTDAPTLADFLLARIAEDEAAAQAANEDGESGGSWWTTGRDRKVWGSPSARVPVAEAHSWRAAPHIAHHDPARVLAECAALRRIVERPPYRREDGAASDAAHDEWAWILRALASVYAEHPDFREEWR